MAIVSTNPLSYKWKLLLNFTVIFLVFSIVTVVFQYHREKTYKEDLIETRLRSYTDIADSIISQTHDITDTLWFARMTRPFPSDLRITIINREGKVLHETTRRSLKTASDNHLNRPEITAALSHKEGSDIRVSKTTGIKYFYFAKRYDDLVIRMALPYNVSIQMFMEPNNISLWFMLLIFPVVLLVLVQLSDHFAKSVSLLREFINAAERGLIDYERIRFPHTELGDIGQAILDKYRQLDNSKQIIEEERERLFQHFHYFKEGIAVFSPDKKKLYANPHFLQYINIILDKPTADISAIWGHKALLPVVDFLKKHQKRNVQTEDDTIFRHTIAAGSNYLSLQILVYNNGYFEMTLSDVTRAEKTRHLKQQMSNNITHELRTPVSSIRGYIETILSCPSLNEERKRHFLERAHAQTVRLTDLIRDVALISKTEEAPDTLVKEDLAPHHIVREICEELQPLIHETGTKLENKIQENLRLHGNYSLVHSIFRNLIENSLCHCNNGCRIRIECYNTDNDYCYFRYYDTGEGVAEEHLPRLFERFYRVSEGRTRSEKREAQGIGGTGLGLSIVRNAVLFHSGSITVRNRKEGGLEFLFTLSNEK